MTRNQIARITTNRLAGWADGLVDAHATPILVVGVGHDEAQGRIEVFTMEGMPDDVIAGFLEVVLARMRAITRAGEIATEVSGKTAGETGTEPQNHTS